MDYAKACSELKQHKWDIGWGFQDRVKLGLKVEDVTFLPGEVFFREFAIHSLRFLIWPPILTIHLARFRSGNFQGYLVSLSCHFVAVQRMRMVKSKS